MRSNHCSDHRYWPKESKRARVGWGGGNEWSHNDNKVCYNRKKASKISLTCPGKTPDTGVEPPEWLGELGRDLQEASSAACFLAVMIFWAAVVQKKTTTKYYPLEKRCITFICLHVLQNLNPQSSGLTLERDTYHQWRLCSHWGRTSHRFHSKCSAARLSRAVWPWHHRLLWDWCCWSCLEKEKKH